MHYNPIANKSRKLSQRLRRLVSKSQHQGVKPRKERMISVGKMEIGIHPLRDLNLIKSKY
jgi:hypothetical protein